MNTEILEYIQRSDVIPSMPQIVTRLLEITNDEQYKIEDVVNLLSSDPGVAGDVLRLANSPLFGVTRQVGSLKQATNLLGIKRIRTLVMGRCLVSKLSDSACPLIDTGYFWRRSLATGVLASRFANQTVSRYREEAFMTGLLSKIGIYLLAAAFPEDYAPAAKCFAPLQSRDFVDKEREAVGISHAAISALVLERWTLPSAIILATQHYLDDPFPADLPDDVEALARALAGASDISRLLCEAPDPESMAKRCEDAMNTVGLHVSVLAHILGDIEKDIEEFASVLRIDVIPSRIYDTIAKTITEHVAMQATG